MRDVLLQSAKQNGGLLSRNRALRLAPDHVLEDAVRAGALRCLYPGIYVLPDHASERTVRRRAALAYCPNAALSHTDALAGWEIGDWLDDVVHLTASADHHACRVEGLALHRRQGFSCQPPAIVVRSGMRIVRVETAIVDSWSLLPLVDRRVPAIVAIRERKTTGSRLLAACEGRRTPKEARRVFGLAAEGCHSPLEVWGHEQVFAHPSLPASRCQVPIEFPDGRIYLDRYIEEAMLGVELDGAAYHGAPGQRERDIARDARVATRGIQTLRYSHLRLFHDSEGVRRELAEICRVRCHQLGRSSA
jgi:hypothetical protein